MKNSNYYSRKILHQEIEHLRKLLEQIELKNNLLHKVAVKHGYTTIIDININIIDPNTLNVKCIIAALLAFLLAPILEINEVTHVPIFSPYSIGNAAVIGINP